MKWAKVRYKQVSIKSIVMDMADIRRRQKEKHVAELACDIKNAGDEPIHAPTIRESDRTLICGRDRVAALLLNGTKKVWVHLADCDDSEAAQLERRENLYRRHMKEGEWAKALNELIGLKKQALRAAHPRNEVPEVSAASDPDSPAFDRKITAAARKEIAKEANITPRAVRKAQQEAAEAEAPDETEQEGAIVYELPEGFNTFGLIVSQDEIREIENITIVLGDWDKANRRTLGHLTDIEKAGGAALAPTHAQKIRERLQAAGHAIRDAIPASLCYFCKSLDALKSACPACGGTGVVGMHGGDNVPPELKLGEPKARVAVNGKFVLVGAAENANVGTEAKPANPAKSIKVTQVDGSVADLDSVIDDDAQAF